MVNTYWSKQTPDKPLFPDLLWSRPEQKSSAGKLLIIGGNLHSFAAPAQAYQYAEKAGIGTARVLLPDVLKKLVGGIFATGEFGPSTPSGSFSLKALADLLDQAVWADGVMLAGDFGRNSETAILLERFMGKYAGSLAITHDSLDYFLSLPQVLQRPKTVLIAGFSQLQKLARVAGFTTAFTFDMDLLRFVEALHSFTADLQAAIIVKHLEQIVVASKGNVCSTQLKLDLPVWRVKTASYASVWCLQNPNKSFESIVTAIYEAAH